MSARGYGFRAGGYCFVRARSAIAAASNSVGTTAMGWHRVLDPALKPLFPDCSLCFRNRALNGDSFPSFTVGLPTPRSKY